MNTKYKQILVALVIAVIVGVLVKSYVDNANDTKNWKMKTAIVARNRIAAGTPITEKDVKPVQVPAEHYSPRNTISQEEFTQYEGQPVAVDIAAGDYVLQPYFSMQQLVGKSLSEQITGEIDGSTDLRAVSLPVDETNSLSRSIVSGDSVDIVFTFTVPRVPQKMSVILLQNKRIIATGSYSVVEQERGGEGRERRYNSLTLLLSAQDAFRLNYARQAGVISILLRNPKDEKHIDTVPLLGIIDVLSASDREKIEEIAKKAISVDLPQADQMKQQLQEIFDKQRRQTQGAK